MLPRRTCAHEGVDRCADSCCGWLLCTVACVVHSDVINRHPVLRPPLLTGGSGFERRQAIRPSISLPNLRIMVAALAVRQNLKRPTFRIAEPFGIGVRSK